MTEIISQPTTRRVPISNAELNPSNSTLYINNIPEKIKVKELIKILTMLFEPFGDIVKIHAKRTYSMRGQAFIVFSCVEDAEKALQEMQSFPLYYKPMCINFARFKSNDISQMDGTYEAVRAEQERFKAEKAMKPRFSRRQFMEQFPGGSSTGPVTRIPTGVVPNKVLFLVELPQEVNGDILKSLFQPFGGFKEVRLVPGKSDIAFIEFEDEAQATVAKNALDRYQISPSYQLKVLFARR